MLSLSSNSGRKAKLEKAEGKVHVLIEQNNGRALVTDLDVDGDDEDGQKPN